MFEAIVISVWVALLCLGTSVVLYIKGATEGSLLFFLLGTAAVMCMMILLSVRKHLSRNYRR